MMGAQKARTLVKNQWRTKTTSSVFLVRIHVWLTIAPAMVAAVARGGRAEGASLGSSRSRGVQVVCPECNYFGRIKATRKRQKSDVDR
jgi:hypothetical protein